MLHVLLVIHLLIAVAMVGVILLQRSEGGALGIGGGGVMTGRAAGNLLTRTTAILAAAFFATSLALALIANTRSQPSSIMDQPVNPAAPAAPATPQAPAAPLSR
jgi:preprotein translocase subunit SecG